jgi:hypothetical protein
MRAYNFAAVFVLTHSNAPKRHQLGTRNCARSIFILDFIFLYILITIEFTFARKNKLIISHIRGVIASPGGRVFPPNKLCKTTLVAVYMISW